MNIQSSNYSPDSTSFSSSDVAPRIEHDGTLTICNGNGSRRGWGTPGTTSTIVLNEDDFCAVHVGFHHKYHGGQQWYYFTTDGDKTRRLIWTQLADEQQQAVIAAAAKNAPSFANMPGVLRAERKAATTRTQTTYKLVEQVGAETFRSLYDGQTEYHIGKRLAEAVGRDAGEDEWNPGVATHAGGFYSHPTEAQVLSLFERGALLPQSVDLDGKALALIECEISGRIVRFPNGKLASSYLKPIRVVRTIAQPAQAVAA